MNKSELLKKADELLAQAELLRKEAEDTVDSWEPKGGEWYVGDAGEVTTSSPAEECKLFGNEHPSKALAVKASAEMRLSNLIRQFAWEYDGTAKGSTFLAIDSEGKIEWLYNDIIPLGSSMMTTATAEACIKQLNNPDTLLGRAYREVYP